MAVGLSSLDVLVVVVLGTVLPFVFLVTLWIQFCGCGICGCALRSVICGVGAAVVLSRVVWLWFVL